MNGLAHGCRVPGAEALHGARPSAAAPVLSKRPRMVEVLVLPGELPVVYARGASPVGGGQDLLTKSYRLVSWRGGEALVEQQAGSSVAAGTRCARPSARPWTGAGNTGTRMGVRSIGVDEIYRGQEQNTRPSSSTALLSGETAPLSPRGTRRVRSAS